MSPARPSLAVRAPAAPRPALRRLALGTLLLVGLAWSLPAPAQWIWRDARKQMHSSDLPPPRDIPEQDILQRPAARPSPRPVTPASAPAGPVAAAGPASAASGGLQAEVQARRQRAEQEEKAKRDAEDRERQAARTENCRNARKELAALDSGQRMVRLNDKGEREYLDDKARADATERARGIIGSDCAP